MPGGGDFASFFRPGGRSFALKSCLPGRGFRRKKIVARGLAGGGGKVTGQIDTCITVCLLSQNTLKVVQNFFIGDIKSKCLTKIMFT